MVRIILSIIFIVVIVVFVSFNVRNTTSLSLFGKPIEDVSVVSVALISFVIGILYSFVFYVSSYFSKLRRGRVKAQEQRTRTKGKEIQAKEEELARSAEPPAAEPKNRTARARKRKGTTSVFGGKDEPESPKS